MKKTPFYVILFLLVLSFAVSCASAPEPESPPPVVETPPAPPPPPPPPPPAVVETPPPPPAEEPPPPAPDTSGPLLEVKLSPLPFSPDGDGVDDELTVSINVESKSPVRDWRIEIREPGPARLLFSEWSGEGEPPETLTFSWDGRSADGELVQSATDYSFALVVNNIYNNSTTFEGIISVDVLVHRDGDNLRVIVPSIVFASNTGDFSGLDPETLADNDRILRRIAEVLNRYPTYQVKVEGHANPTTPPGTTARNREETGTPGVKGLRPLSDERAKAVVDYLAGLGVGASRLTSTGAGGSRPVVDFDDRDNWWKNRRVEFILVK